jgi:hypothetical protein
VATGHALFYCPSSFPSRVRLHSTESRFNLGMAKLSMEMVRFNVGLVELGMGDGRFSLS